jgi:hypothetical protein
MVPGTGHQFNVWKLLLFDFVQTMGTLGHGGAHCNPNTQEAEAGGS